MPEKYAGAVRPAAAPAEPLPPLSCDCHLHVFGDPAKFPFAAKRGYTPYPALPAEMKVMLRKLGLERVVIVTPHYTDHSSYMSPTHRWHLSSFSLWFFSEKPGVYDYYAPAKFRMVRTRVKLLQVWRWLGMEILVNAFPRFVN